MFSSIAFYYLPIVKWLFIQSNGFKYCYVPPKSNSTTVICLHIVKWLNGFILTIDGILTIATTPGQSRPGSNGNDGVLCIPNAPAILEPHHQIVYCDIHVIRGVVLSLCRESIGVFCSPSQGNCAFWAFIFAFGMLLFLFLSFSLNDPIKNK